MPYRPARFCTRTAQSLPIPARRPPPRPSACPPRSPPLAGLRDGRSAHGAGSPTAPIGRYRVSRDRRALPVGNEAPVWQEQDRRPVSPGHSCPALAAAQQHYDIYRRPAHLKPPPARARLGLVTRSLTAPLHHPHHPPVRRLGSRPVPTRSRPSDRLEPEPGRTVPRRQFSIPDDPELSAASSRHSYPG